MKNNRYRLTKKDGSTCCVVDSTADRCDECKGEPVDGSTPLAGRCRNAGRRAASAYAPPDTSGESRLAAIRANDDRRKARAARTALPAMKTGDDDAERLALEARYAEERRKEFGLPPARDFSGRGTPAAPSKKRDFVPPNPYDAPLAAMRAAKR